MVKNGKRSKRKGNKQQQQGKGKKGQRKASVKSQVRSAFDAGAMAHRRLLLDPCNAPLGSPVYSGMGTGQFRRFRTLLAAEGESVEGAYVFQLGTNTMWKASHVAATAGSSYTFAATPVFQDPSITAIGAAARCIAGCVKVRYVGTESARAGTVGLLTVPFAYGGASVISNAEDDTRNATIVNRTGEVLHEVKFAPSAADEEFHTQSRSGGIVATERNSCLMACYRATPARSIVFEVTAVYEVELSTVLGPNGQFGPGDQVLTSVAPSSNVTLNQLLRTLGPVTQWAYSHAVAPTIRAMAGSAGNTVYSAIGAASRGAALLTL